MDFNEYQVKARSTAMYPDLGNNIYYPTLGLSGESGEALEKYLNLLIDFNVCCVKASHVSEIVKKIMRDSKGLITEEKKLEIIKELGDQLWYSANVCTELNVDFNTVAEVNVAKLAKRKQEDKLHGSGDNR